MMGNENSNGTGTISQLLKYNVKTHLPLSSFVISLACSTKNFALFSLLYHVTSQTQLTPKSGKIPTNNEDKPCISKRQARCKRQCLRRRKVTAQDHLESMPKFLFLRSKISSLVNKVLVVTLLIERWDISY